MLIFVLEPVHQAVINIFLWCLHQGNQMVLQQAAEQPDYTDSCRTARQEHIQRVI